MITYGIARSRRQIREARAILGDFQRFCSKEVPAAAALPPVSENDHHIFTCAWDDDKIIGTHVSRRLENPNLNYPSYLDGFNLEIIALGFDPNYDVNALCFNLVHTVYDLSMKPGEKWITTTLPGPTTDFVLENLIAVSSPISGTPFVKLTGKSEEPKPHMEVRRLNTVPDWIN